MNKNKNMNKQVAMPEILKNSKAYLYSWLAQRKNKPQCPNHFNKTIHQLAQLVIKSQQVIRHTYLLDLRIVGKSSD